MSFLLFVRKIRSASLSPLRAHAAFAPGFLLRLRRFKAVGLCPTTHKLFEKSLTKNFYAPTASRLRPCRRQEGGLSCPATGKLYAASRLHSLQKALVQLRNFPLTRVAGVAGEVNRRRRFTGRIPRSLRDFVFAGRKTGILSPMAFLAYSKLLYSWAISSSLVSLGLPGQQASA